MTDTFSFDDDTFVRLLTNKNDAEPGTLRHNLIAFMNTSTVLENILGRDYTHEDIHEMVDDFTNLFNEHYGLPESTYFGPDTQDILTEIFTTWWAEVEASKTHKKLTAQATLLSSHSHNDTRSETPYQTSEYQS